MRLTVLTLHFDAEGGFDTEALDAFSREYEVLEMSDHFFHFEGRPWWAVFICYREAAKEGASNRRTGH